MASDTPAEAFPLSWPTGKPRAANRANDSFQVSFAKARDEIAYEVRRLGGTGLVISSNVPLRRDGLPYADFKTPDDPGVAVYFAYKGKQMCFACDRWKRGTGNMRAISLTIGALRGVARWGTGDMMEAAFTGFAALPAPGQTTARGWREVLEVGPTATLDQAQHNYRKLSAVRHPDRGGTHDAMSELNWAWSQAQESLRASS